MLASSLPVVFREVLYSTALPFITSPLYTLPFCTTMALPIAQLLLLGISAYGFYALWGFSTANGMMQLADRVQESGKLPNGQPWPFEITSNPIMEQLRLLSNIFWPLVDGSMPDASLQAFYFAGQLIPFVTVLWLESRRRSLSSTNITSL